MKFFFIFLSWINFFFTKDKYELSICAIFQNDSKYIPEWIEFHRAQGVQHFYLYNNCSEDDWEKTLSPYIQEGIVEVEKWSKTYSKESEWIPIQCAAYDHCIIKNKYSSKWIAFIDTDEFLFNPNGQPLIETLKEYDSYSGVCVNWVMYGTSKVKKAESITEELVFRSSLDIPENKHVKSIVNPMKVSSCPNPHCFFFKEGFAVTENKEFIQGVFSRNNSVNNLRINHYWQRDEHFFDNVFCPRKKRWGRTQEELEVIRGLYNDEYDPILSHSSG